MGAGCRAVALVAASAWGNSMNIQAFTRAISDSGGGMKEVQSLFACQREAAERDRARFGLQERLDSLTRLENAIKRRAGDIIRALDAEIGRAACRAREC